MNGLVSHAPGMDEERPACYITALYAVNGIFHVIPGFFKRQLNCFYSLLLIPVRF